MVRCVKIFVATLAGVALLGPAALARDGFGVRGSFGGSFGRPGISGGPHHGWDGRWRPPHRHYGRGFVPLYLDHRYSDYGYRQPGVVIQQTFINGAPRAAMAAGGTDVPVVLGIREAAPEQPAVYVVNETTGSVAGSRPRAAGPRIVQLGAEDRAAEIASDETATGARIIQLSVPVGP